MKDNYLQSFSIRNTERASDLVGTGMVVNGNITVKNSHRNAIFPMSTEEIKKLIIDLNKLILNGK